MATLEEKKEVVTQLTEDLRSSAAVYLMDYQGIPVEVDTELRKGLSRSGITYRVVKNSFLKRAFETLEITGLDSMLNGMTAVMLGSEEDPMLPAKEVVAFHKKNPDFLSSKGTNVSGDHFAGSQLEDLAKMPGRQELISEVVSLALGPGANLVALLKGPGGKLASQLESLQEKLEEN